MSAIELIHKVGLGCAKAQVGLILELSQNHEMDLHNIETFGVCVDVFELKRLVESLELIDQIGGIEIAKHKVFAANFNRFLTIPYLIKNKPFEIYVKRVEEAIEDHEAVYGNVLDPVIKLKAGLTKLRDKFINDAHALTQLGDLDKSRVYNGIANQLDHLLKGGA